MKHILIGMLAAAAWGGDWSKPVEVYHDERLAVTYRARLDGGLLLVDAKIEPGWHTFCMDNKRRQAERLAGKASLGIEKPTEIKLSGLTLAGPWLQTAPKDFSKPEIQWFTFGFENQAQFAAKVTGDKGAVTLRAQACSESICKNIDVTMDVSGSKEAAAAPAGLVEVKP